MAARACVSLAATANRGERMGNLCEQSALIMRCFMASTEQRAGHRLASANK